MEYASYALLFAVAAPVAVVLVMNTLLALGGESGTLLLPEVRPFPTMGWIGSPDARFER